MPRSIQVASRSIEDDNPHLRKIKEYIKKLTEFNNELQGRITGLNLPDYRYDRKKGLLADLRKDYVNSITPYEESLNIDLDKPLTTTETLLLKGYTEGQSPDDEIKKELLEYLYKDDYQERQEAARNEGRRFEENFPTELPSVYKLNEEITGKFNRELDSIENAEKNRLASATRSGETELLDPIVDVIKESQPSSEDLFNRIFAEVGSLSTRVPSSNTVDELDKILGTAKALQKEYNQIKLNSVKNKDDQKGQITKFFESIEKTIADKKTSIQETNNAEAPAPAPAPIRRANSIRLPSFDKSALSQLARQSLQNSNSVSLASGTAPLAKAPGTLTLTGTTTLASAAAAAAAAPAAASASAAAAVAPGVAPGVATPAVAPPGTSTPDKLQPTTQAATPPTAAPGTISAQAADVTVPGSAAAAAAAAAAGTTSTPTPAEAVSAPVEATAADTPEAQAALAALAAPAALASKYPCIIYFYNSDALTKYQKSFKCSPIYNFLILNCTH